MLPPGQPTRDLLLAQALDACITAERRLPGSAQEIIARQPAWARGDLQRLVGLTGSLDAATSNAIMSSEFRVAARKRLMQRIARDSGRASGAGGSLEDGPADNQDGAGPAPGPGARQGVVRLTSVSTSPGISAAPGPKFAWATRAIASLLAAVLAVAATLTATASALPGEPLYGLKEAREELAVRLAADDQQRALALLQQANARLDETARLLQQGRTQDATTTTLRYDQVVQRATTSYVGTIDTAPANVPATVNAVNMEASLSQDQNQLQALLETAPELARADLREALVATERGRALVADPRPFERTLGRGDRKPASAVVAAAVPTLAAEDEPTPTVVPTEVAEVATAVPTQRPALVLATPTPTAVVAEKQADEADAETPVVAQVGGFVGTDDSDAHGDSPAQDTPNARRGDQGRGSNNPRAEVAVVSPTVVIAHDDSEDTPETLFEVTGRTGGGGDDHPRATDVALPISARTGGSAESRGTEGPQSQTDKSGHQPEVTAPILVRPTQTSPPKVASTVAQVVVVAPEHSSDRNAHDGGGDARVSLTPTPQVTATKPSSTSASTSAQATSGPTVSSGRRSSDSDQKSSTSTVPAFHSGGGDGDHSDSDTSH